MPDGTHGFFTLTLTADADIAPITIYQEKFTDVLYERNLIVLMTADIVPVMASFK